MPTIPLWLFAAVGSAAAYFGYRRTIARSGRVLARLGEDAAPGH
ncbi:hypothetical protein [Streptomyces sp. H27-C3]|nr:hypothetical protein [Streptomyces sp. H27-C3]MDJ0461106.1 hypothetical protein [Streptomyces sp. H27-C3]